MGLELEQAKTVEISVITITKRNMVKFACKGLRARVPIHSRSVKRSFYIGNILAYPMDRAFAIRLLSEKAFVMIGANLCHAIPGTQNGKHRCYYSVSQELRC